MRFHLLVAVLSLAGTPAFSSEPGFTPSDSRVDNFFFNGQNLAVVFQYRIEFYQIPAFVSPQTGGFLDLQLTNKKTGKPIPWKELPRISEMTFKEHVETLPRQGPHKQDDFLVCANGLAEYSGSDEEEARLIERNGTYTMPWTNEKGEYRLFCGIVATSGKVIFKFPITQASPKSLLNPIGYSANRKKAGVYLGEMTAGGESLEVLNAREVLVWNRASNKLERFHDADLSKIIWEEMARRYLKDE